MSIFQRFFGKEDADNQEPEGILVANPDLEIESTLSLQLLFSGNIPVDVDQIIRAMQQLNPSMSDAQCDLEAGLAGEDKAFGLAGWGEHVIQIVGFDCPMPGDVVERCVQCSPYPDEVKEQGLAHQGHMMLWYRGYDMTPLNQYVALGMLAGALAEFGAVVTLNESACASVPAALMTDAAKDSEPEIIRYLPLNLLYCGVIQTEFEDGQRWTRSVGANLLNLPDFALRVLEQDHVARFYQFIGDILPYLLDSDATLEPGHTMQVDEEIFIRVNNPTGNDEFFKSDGTLLVMEFIAADEINRV
jgi:hypothetical protein